MVVLADDDNVVAVSLTSVSVNSPSVVEIEAAIVLCVSVSADETVLVNGFNVVSSVPADCNVVVSADVVIVVSVSVVAKKNRT